MGSTQEHKSHAVCIPAPAQGHINPMLKLAKLLHSNGFMITFVITEYDHRRLQRSLGSNALKGLPSFHFETYSDGLPPPKNPNVHPDTPSLVKSIFAKGLGQIKSVFAKASADYSPVTCLLADLYMGYTLPVAEELGIPAVLLWTSGPGSLLCYDQTAILEQKGLIPLKDPSYLVNGYLDTVIDCIPAMSGIRLKDIPSFSRMVYPGEKYMIEFILKEIERAKTAKAVIFNTFNELEYDILDTLSLKLPKCYGIGPLHLLENNNADKSLDSIQSSLWKEEPECLEWLDGKEPLSVIYVNFGSITVITPQQLVEFCWGLAKSNQSFLWVIRPDLVGGDSVELPPEFLAETSNRGMFVSWCPQEKVLNHPSIGGFLTHSGWNSTLESICYGVPMICWPFFSDQRPNCWLSCNKWKIALEIDNNVKRDEVSKLVVDLMNGEKGKQMRKNVIDLKNKAEAACTFPSGSSVINLEKLINLLQSSPK
ncbi:7-deoxyloganetin glucosyltransferase-like [Bidens hawaiensis]|uniref:7-deoxyloganetin glucosyltransferase-like n=1 Tax=Bidens hawaiensis TaxID=980011 RepID=UPI004049F69A